MSQQRICSLFKRFFACNVLWFFFSFLFLFLHIFLFLFLHIFLLFNQKEHLRLLRSFL